jgi:hypothetical protein
MIDSWFGVLSGSALDDPDHRCPGTVCRGIFFSVSVWRIFSASVCSTAAHFPLPTSNYLARKFTHLNANASAGLRPHVEQHLIATKHFTL